MDRIGSDVATTEPGRASDVPRTTTPDRYALLEEVGAGGMGVVWAAYDRHLDRKIALKLLHDRYLGAEDQERLAREARTMARLAHPNVVAVFDVGVREGRTFVAMEFVRGQSLAEWLGTKPAWPDVVTVFQDVVRGLAAAHAAGIVHRDVKPGNILVGEDGRARIADFGVSRADEVTGAPGISSARVVETTGFVGSPAYMAPEQLRGERVDARADQFGLCVALYVALTGERPFQRDEIDELLAEIERGAPPVTGVPAWLAAIVARGLAANPADRFSSMEALARAFAGPAPSKLRRAGWLAGAAIAVAVPVTWFAIDRSTSAVEEPAISCSGEARAAFGDTWTPARRAALVDAFAKSGVPGADAAAEAIVQTADRLATAWVKRWETTCRAARVDHTWPAELGALSIRCLDENRTKLGALLDGLDHADAAAIASGGTLLRRSDPVTACGDPDLLRGRVLPPRDPARAAEIAALEARVEALGTLFGLRRVDEAARVFPALQADVEGSGLPRLQTRMLGFEAILEQQRHDLPAAIATSKRGYLLARRNRDVEAAAQAAADLTWLVGVEKGDAAAGDDWANLALVEIESIPNARVAHRVYSSIGSMAEHHGDGKRAVEAQRKAYAIARRYYGDDHYTTARAALNLGSALNEQGAYGEAVPMYRAALATLKPDIGALAHALALNYFATMLANAGELAEASATAARSVELGQALGAQGADLGSLLQNQGFVQNLAGELERAEASFASARAAYTSIDDRGLAASSLGSLGGVRAELATRRDDPALEKQAIADLEQAARVIAKEWSPTHVDRALALESLAILHADRGRCDQATPVAEQALGIFDQDEGTADVAGSLVVLGRCLLANQKPSQAVAKLERAAKLLATTPDPLRAAAAKAWLGLALRQRDDSTGADTLLHAARAKLATDPARYERLLARIDRELSVPRPSKAP